MKTQGKDRLFEVMGRLDKTFKPLLKEEFETPIDNDEETVTIDATEETPEIDEPKELSTEEKLEAITAKIDGLYAMVHGDEAAEEEAEKEEEKIEGEPEDEVEVEVNEEKPKIPVTDIAKVGK